jgi:hypothetical protein
MRTRTNARIGDIQPPDTHARTVEGKPASGEFACRSTGGIAGVYILGVMFMLRTIFVTSEKVPNTVHTLVTPQPLSVSFAILIQPFQLQTVRT